MSWSNLPPAWTFVRTTSSALVPRLGVDVHRDAPAVVGDRDRAVGVDRHVDVPAVAGHRLVDRVVHDLVDQVMQPARRRVADVHPGPQPDRLDPFEHPDARPGVCGRRILVSLPAVARGEVVAHLTDPAAPRSRRRPQSCSVPPSKISLDPFFSSSQVGPDQAGSDEIGNHRSPRVAAPGFMSYRLVVRRVRSCRTTASRVAAPRLWPCRRRKSGRAGQVRIRSVATIPDCRRQRRNEDRSGIRNPESGISNRSHGCAGPRPPRRFWPAPGSGLKPARPRRGGVALGSAAGGSADSPPPAFSTGPTTPTRNRMS